MQCQVGLYFLSNSCEGQNHSVTLPRYITCSPSLFPDMWNYLFDVGSDILLNVVLLQSQCGALHGILLHVLRHVGIFDHCLPFRHGCSGKQQRHKLRIHLRGIDKQTPQLVINPAFLSTCRLLCAEHHASGEKSCWTPNSYIITDIEYRN